MKVLAIIPARGGSKRLKNKNIFPLKGLPLIAYSIKACQGAKSIFEVVVSSDSDEILEVAETFGAKCHKREAALADDDTPKIVAIRSVIKDLEKSMDFDHVAIIQANSPELLPEHIESAISLMDTQNLWEVMSADSNGVQNAGIRLVKKEVAFQPFLSAHCGFIICDLKDVHTIEDIRALEETM